MLKFAAKYCCKLKVAGSDSHYRVIPDFALQSIFYMDGCFWELGEMILLILKLVGNLPFSLYWAGGVGSFNLHQQRTIIQDPSTAYQLEEASWSLCHVEPFLHLLSWALPGTSVPWTQSTAPQAHSRAFGWVDQCYLLWVTVGNQD